MSLQDLLKSNNPREIQSTRERARAYIRVSHERSAEKNISPETQRRALASYADQQGYEIAEWYTDLAKSAFRDDDKRVDFHRMIADAKRDPLTTVILVYKYDRFSRGDTAQAIQGDLLRHGVRIESVTEGYYDPDTETGAIMGPLTWSLNRLFSIKLRNVVRPNMKTNFEQRDPGTGWAYKNGGWAQWGYKTQRVPAGKGKHGDIHKQIWVLDDTEVAGKPVHEWAKTMLLEWRLRDRMGYEAIAARLTEMGVPTSTGRAAWGCSSIQALLGDMSRLFQYSGYAFWNREDCSDRKNRRQRDPSEWIVVENAHPAIISEQECEAIWAMVASKHKPKSGRKGAQSRFALSGGYLKCKHCGANYSGFRKKPGDYYACGSHLYRRGTGCSRSWYIPREELETAIIARISKYLAMPDEKLEAWLEEANDALRSEWKEFIRTAPARNAKLKQYEVKAANVAAAIATSGPLPQLLDELAVLNGYIARLKRLDSADKPALLTIERLREFSTKVDAAKSPTEVEARREVLQSLVIELVVDAENKSVEGTIADPRSIMPVSLAAPRGVVGNTHIHAWNLRDRRVKLSWLGRRFRAA